MWNLESHTKLMWKNPLTAVGADWGRHFENGSSFHFAESRHATKGRVGHHDFSTKLSCLIISSRGRLKLWYKVFHLVIEYFLLSKIVYKRF